MTSLNDASKLEMTRFVKSRDQISNHHSVQTNTIRREIRQFLVSNSKQIQLYLPNTVIR